MSFSRREFLATSASAAAVLLTSGCDEAQSLGARWRGSTVAALPDDLAPPAREILDEFSHVLHRLTFGPRPGEYARVRRMGVAAFMEEQLAPESIEDTACDRLIRRLEVLHQPPGELYEYKEKYVLEQMTRGAILRAVASRRQLHEVMVDFWSDHFNIDPSKGDCRWLKAADDREVIREHALGNFSALLRASALSPAMLWYLDGRVNRRDRPEDRPNENYARELMELHTLGVYGGYTQQDVMEVARCLTGWTVRDRKQFRKGRVAFEPQRHDDGAKVVLGQPIPAGLGAADLDRVLELVVRHPSTARHLATKLCQRFIADEPPLEAIDATAQAFTRTEGDIRATLRALFATEAFQASRGRKLKRPLHFVVSALRATNAETDGGPPLIEALLRMGHAPFRYPTPDGYPEAATHWTSTLLWRWNFAVGLSAGKLPGTRIALETLRERLGDDGLMATCYGRQANAAERRAFHASGDGLAVLLASPGFQRC